MIRNSAIKFIVQPASHADTHASGGGDPISPADIGAAESSHGHNLSDLGQSGATDGQVPAWDADEGEWVPADQTGEGNGVIVLPSTPYIGYTFGIDGEIFEDETEWVVENWYKYTDLNGKMRFWANGIITAGDHAVYYDDGYWIIYINKKIAFKALSDADSPSEIPAEDWIPEDTFTGNPTVALSIDPRIEVGLTLLRSNAIYSVTSVQQYGAYSFPVWKSVNLT